MKQIKLLTLLMSLLAITSTNLSYGFSVHSPTTIDERYETETPASLSNVINLSAKQFSELTGKRMNMWDKLAFRIMKTKMKHDLKKNPNLTLDKYYAKDGKKRLGTGWWILIGVVALVLLVGVIFIISYGGDGQ
ncbi:MAG: hypothetical protein ABIO81_05360 [Ginsengibacter sp.]